MATAKISATLDRDVLDEIRKTVGPRQLSAFLSEAAREKLQRSRILAYLDSLDRRHGAADRSTKGLASKRIALVLEN